VLEYWEPTAHRWFVPGIRVTAVGSACRFEGVGVVTVENPCAEVHLNVCALSTLVVLRLSPAIQIVDPTAAAPASE
jgi:hypothetical protein